MNNWGVKTRLMAGFGLVLSLLVVVTVVALISLGEIKSKIHELVGERYPAAVAGNQLITLAYDIDLIFRNAALADDFDGMETELKKLDEQNAKEDKLINTLKAQAKDEKSAKLMAEVERNNAAMDAQKTTLINQLKVDRAIGGKFINTEYAPISKAYRDSVIKLVQNLGLQMEEGRQHVDTSTTAAFSVISGVAAFAVVIGLVLAWMIGTQVIRSLKAASEVAEKIATGDLTHDWRMQKIGQDEIGNLLGSLKKMQENLMQIIAQIRDNAQDVSRAASTLNHASQQIHQGTDSQSAAASNMAAAVEEMSVSMDQVAHNSVDVEQKARGAGNLAKTGSGDVVAAAQEMQEISKEVGVAAQQIADLGRNIEEIGSIIIVIKDVADQTNLLALNAAIEAARAGDLGRGFAVVADEVRKLAERTTQSATQITAMVSAIQGSAQDAVSRMSKGSRRVDEGLVLAKQASDSIGRINDSSNDVVESVFGITEQVHEQRSAARDIAVNVEKIAQMAEENSISARNMVDSITQLESMASQLGLTVQRFKVR